MSAKTEEFKSFVKMHPGLKKLVYKDQKSWQSIFEEWMLLGSENDIWNEYKDDVVIETKEQINTNTKKNQSDSNVANVGEMIKTCVNYIKKIDTDSVAKTVNNIQKLMTLVAGLGAVNTVNAQTKMTGDPLFDKRFDEWY